MDTHYYGHPLRILTIVDTHYDGQKLHPTAETTNSRCYGCNNNNYNLLECNWFKKLQFSTYSVAKLLSDSLLLVVGQFNKPIAFKVTCVRACKVVVTCVRALLCFWHLIAVGSAVALESFHLLCRYFNANFLFLL